MTAPDADVIVVGAGPGGAAAAIVLARSGKRVILADRARFPRDKCCGDGITGAALPRLRALGLEPARVASWRYVDRSVFVSPAGRSVALRTGRNSRKVLAIATRSDLDAALVDVARDAGVRVVEEARLVDASVPDGHVSLDFAGAGTLRAPFVIAADGAWSPTRRALAGPGNAPDLPKWQAARAYVGGVSGAAAAEARVWFDTDLLPGYAWSFPLADGRVNVGVGALRQAGGGGGWIVRRLAHLLDDDRVRSFLGPSAGEPSRAVVWPIPTEVRRDALVGGSGRVLFVGDAVGATDPMTGEGIAEALQTGVLAAEAVAVERSRSYASTAGRALVGRHRRRELCSALLRRRVLATAGLAAADRSDWTRAQFTRWIFE